MFYRSALLGRRELRIFSRQACPELRRRNAKLAKVRVYFPIPELVFLSVLFAFARDTPIWLRLRRAVSVVVADPAVRISTDVDTSIVRLDAQLPFLS